MKIDLDEEEVKYLTDLLPSYREAAGADDDREQWDLIDRMLEKLGWQDPPKPISRGLQEGQWKVVLDILREHEAEVKESEGEQMIKEIINRLEGKVTDPEE